MAIQGLGSHVPQILIDPAVAKISEETGDGFLSGIPELIAYFLSFIPTENVVGSLFVCAEWHGLMMSRSELRMAVDLEWAKAVAETVEDPMRRLQAYLAIIKEEAKLSIGQAKHTLFRAKDIVPFIENHTVIYNETLVDMVAIEATWDLLSAEQMLQVLQQPYYVAKGHIEIAKIHPKGGHLQAAKLIIPKLHEGDQNLLYLDVIRIEVTFDLALAKQTAQLIRGGTVTGECEAGRAFRMLMQAERKVPVAYPLNTHCSELHRQDEIFKDVCVLGQFNLNEAKRLALTLVNLDLGDTVFNFKDRAICHLATIEVSHELREAAKMVLSVETTHWKIVAQLILAQAQREMNLIPVFEEIGKVGVGWAPLQFYILMRDVFYHMSKENMLTHHATLIELCRPLRENQFFKFKCTPAFLEIEVKLGFIESAIETVNTVVRSLERTVDKDNLYQELIFLLKPMHPLAARQLIHLIEDPLTRVQAIAQVRPRSF